MLSMMGTCNVLRVSCVRVVCAQAEKHALAAGTCADRPAQLFDVGTEASCAAGSVSRCPAQGASGPSGAGRRVRESAHP